MSNIINIGDFSVRSKPFDYSRQKCKHLQIELDDAGEIVRCLKCGVQIGAYWALRTMTKHWQEQIDKVAAERKAVDEAKSTHFHLIAARKVEAAWRRKNMIPTCPHCHRGIFPQDGFGGSAINKEMELRRRKTDQEAKQKKE